jgi:hypothetical protein
MALLCLFELDNVWRLLYIFARALRNRYLVGTRTLDLLVWIHIAPRPTMGGKDVRGLVLHVVHHESLMPRQYCLNYHHYTVYTWTEMFSFRYCTIQ